MKVASAQVPLVVHVQTAEGASKLPFTLNSCFVAPNVWTKFSIRNPGVSYYEFLAYCAQCYQSQNETMRRFFVEFSQDPARRDAILREPVARQAMKCAAAGPFVKEGLVPKPEPVEEGVVGPPEYVYLIPDVSSDDAAIVKHEQV
jgi:hypothetical protein